MSDDDDEWKVVRRKGAREPSVTMDAINAKRCAREKANNKSNNTSSGAFASLAQDESVNDGRDAAERAALAEKRRAKKKAAVGCKRATAQQEQQLQQKGATRDVVDDDDEIAPPTEKKKPKKAAPTAKATPAKATATAAAAPVVKRATRGGREALFRSRVRKLGGLFSQVVAALLAFFHALTFGLFIKSVDDDDDGEKTKPSPPLSAAAAAAVGTAKQAPKQQQQTALPAGSAAATGGDKPPMTSAKSVGEPTKPSKATATVTAKTTTPAATAAAATGGEPKPEAPKPAEEDASLKEAAAVPKKKKVPPPPPALYEQLSGGKALGAWSDVDQKDAATDSKKQRLPTVRRAVVPPGDAKGHNELVSCAVGLYKLNSAYPELESAWFQPLNLKSDILVTSLCCFQIQLVPLQRGGERRGARHGGLGRHRATLALDRLQPHRRRPLAGPHGPR
jgi:hypothetical protein